MSLFIVFIFSGITSFVTSSPFRYKFSALFWNCIWYFFLNRLDYSFILPYEDNVQKVALKANLEIVSRQKARVHKIEHNMKNSN